MRAISTKTALNGALSIFFVASLVIPLLGLWTEGSGAIEKRTLAPFPKVSPTMAGIEEFPTDFGAYVSDHFGLRNSLLSLQSKLGQEIFNESGSSKVIKGKGDWLFYTGDESLDDIQRTSHFSPADLKQWKSSIDERANWLKTQGIAYRFVVAPDKQSIYGEELTARYSWRGPSRLDGFRTYMGRSPSFVDLAPPLLQRKQVAGGRLFLHTDTHWTSYGAYVGYRAIMASLSDQQLPTPMSIPDSEFVTEDVSYQRDLAQMAHVNTTEPDIAPGGPTNSCGQFNEVVVPVGLDFSSVTGTSSYACSGKAKTALVFHDSFMESMMPYLTQEFGRVVYVWAEPDDEMFVRMVQQEKPDIVIEERVERAMQFVPKSNLTAVLEKLNNPTKRTFLTADLLAQQNAYELIQKHAQLVSDAKGRYLEVDGKEWARVQAEDQFDGSLDTFQRTNNGYWATGWVGFPEDKERADYIVLTVGARVIYVGAASFPRKDVANYFHEPELANSGFDFVIPNEIVNVAKGELRAFALRDRKLISIKLDPLKAHSFL